MALTDAQAKIINQTKKKKEERKKKAAASNPSVSSQNLTLGRSTSQLSPLQLAKQDASTKTTTRNKVDYAKQSKASINTQKSVQANKEKQAAKSQIKSQLTLSESDAKLPSASQKGILDAKVAYEQAKTAGDKEGMAKAHQQAEKIRSRFGYSGGAAGTEKIEGPGLTEKDKVTLNKTGQQALLSALTLGNKERAEEIRNAKGFQAVDHSRQKDGEGREVNVGALSKAQLREGERRAQDYLYAAMAAVPGSIMSAFETADTSATNKSVENNREYLQDKANRLGEYEAKLKLVQNGEGIPEWGSESWLEQQIRIAKNAQALLSKGEKVDTFRPGHSLLRESNEAAARAMEGMTGPGALLAKAGLSAAQMLPGVAASFIPGVGPALGATILGTQAAGSKMYELNEQTSRANYLSKMMGGSPEDYGAVTPDESLVRGVVSGAIEGLTERIPIGSLLKIVKGGGGANFLANIAKQAGVEATEESASTVLNHLADLAAKDPTASLTLSEVMEAAAVGAISGAGFGAGGSVLNSAINRNRQKTGLDTLLETAGVRAPETQQNEPEQMFEQPQQETPAQAETPVQGQERGEGVAETFSEPSEPVAPPSEPFNQEPQAEFEAMGAASEGFDPYTNAMNKYGTIDPGENPARMVDVPLSTDGENRVRRWARTAMEAEVTTEETVKNLERDIVNNGFSYRPRKDKQSLEKAIGVIEDYGIDPALAQWQEVVDGRRSAGKDDIVLAETLYINAERTGDTELAARLAAEIAAEGTRMGQGVQALRLLKKATKEGRVYYIRKSVEYVKQELQGRMGDRAKDISIPDELIQNYMDAQGKAAEDEALDAIYTNVAEQIPPTLNDRITAWRYFAMLGNPKTHLKNMLGNLLFGGVYKGSNQVSALMQKALLAEQDRTRSFIANDKAKDFAKADWEEIKGVLDGDKYNSAYTAIQRKVQDRSLGVFNRPAKFSSDKMNQADTWAKKGQYIHSMSRFITARGWDPANLTKEQLETARSHAILDAQRATFTEASDLAKTLTKLEQKGKAWNVAIGATMPFKGVPINIAKQGFNLSPAGLLKSLTYDLYKVKKGDRTAAEAIDHISQGLTGTSIAAFGVFLAAQGILHGMDSDDEKERLLDEATGEQEYSLDLEVLGDKLGLDGPEYTYTIDWMAPAALPLFFGAEVYQGIVDAAAELGEEDFPPSKAFEIALDAVVKTFEPMMNMTVVSGISDVVRAAAYNQNNAPVGIATEMVEGFMGQFVPTLLGQIARTIDDTRRSTFGDKNKGFTGFQKFIQQQGNKIPGLSQKNVPYLNVWGETEDTGNMLLRALENAVSPGYIAKKTGGSTEAELKRLHEAGYEGVLPGMVEKSAKVNDKYVTADQWVNMQTTRGQTAKAVLDSFIGTEQYNAMTDDERAKFVKKVLEYGSNMGKVKGGADAEETFARWQEAAQNAKAEVGLSEAEIIAASAYQSVLGENLDDDVKASFKQGQFEQWVDSRTDLTEEQKSYIKDNIKFYSMIPANADRYNKVVDSGYSIERTEELLTARSEYADSNNGLYEFVISQESDYAAQEKLYNAFKDKGATKSWGELAKEQAPVSARIKKAQTALDEAVPAEKQTAFATAISDAGARSQKATKLALLSVDATDAERVAYYNLISARQGWKKSYYQVDMS